MAKKFSPAWARALPDDVLRAVIRERTHHLLEDAVQDATAAGAPVHGSDTVRGLLEVWRERGLALDGADLQWAGELLQMADSGQRSIAPAPPVLHDAAEVMDLLAGRRSIRSWDGRPVPAELLEMIVGAGLWAPSACNLQTLRVIMVTDAADKVLFRGEVRNAPAFMVICQDRRPYEVYGAGIPEYNRMLDLGAAMQNMLLLAHALGLGAVWLTFTERQIGAIREHFHVADHIDIVSYIGLGWPTVQPLAPGRMDAADVILPHG
jgi:nitroreductase